MAARRLFGDNGAMRWLIVSLFGCAGGAADSGPSAGADAPLVSLVVEGGYGSGTYAPDGETIDVFASVIATVRPSCREE